MWTLTAIVLGVAVLAVLWVLMELGPDDSGDSWTIDPRDWNDDDGGYR